MIAPGTTILTDIEGTTTDVAFVHDVLFPYARRALPDLLRARAGEPAIAGALQDARQRAGTPTQPLEETIALLLRWIDEDRKETALKTLQGIAWAEGYRSGELVAPIYPDAHAALRRWHQGGHPLCVYSSGSEQAQQLLFAHTTAGDLRALFSAWFDTRVGAKVDAASYRAIAAQLARSPHEILFLSDLPAEVAAARAAGSRAVRIDRARASDAPPTREDGVAVVGSFAWIDPEKADGIGRSDGHGGAALR